MLHTLWRQLVIFFIVVVVGLGTVTPVSADEGLNSFDSKITINQDTSITIQERLTYFTDVSRHGIYRYIPVRYVRGNLRYTTKINDIQITDQAGNNIQYDRSFDDGNVVLKIGDPDRTFSGEQIYVITYRVTDALQIQDGQPELYWDITGEGWQFPVAMSRAEIVSAHAAIIGASCFSGEVGQNDGQCQVVNQSQNSATLVYPLTIRYGDNFTVLLKLNPDNQILFPSATQRLIKQITDNWIFIPLILPAVVIGIWWWQHGRDKVFITGNRHNPDESQPQTTAPLLFRPRAPFIYEPLETLTPGEAGTLIDDTVDNQDVIAEIIELAHLKYLKITGVETSKLLGLSKSTDYVLKKLRPDATGLPPHQAYLFNQLFTKGSEIKISSLKGKFYDEMTATKELIMASLVSKKLYVANPTTTMIKAFVVVFVLSFISFWWLIDILNQGYWIALPIFVISEITAFVLAKSMPAKSALGSTLALQAQGLRETINRGKWREKIKEKHLFVEAVLPFAVALGVVEKLSRDMEDLDIKPPTYVSSGFTNFATTTAFMNSFSSHATSSLSYNPSSSSWSSSGGGGGGSSGGGGGGGGGGSW